MAVFNVIAHTELSSTAATVDFSSIPSSYDHLYIRLSARSNAVATRDTIFCRVNNDSNTKYSRTNLFAGSTTMSSYDGGSQALWYDFMDIPAHSLLSDAYSGGIIWIPNYSNTSYYTQALTYSATVSDSTTDYHWGMQNVSALYKETAAVSRLTFSLQTGSYMPYSVFTIYGVQA